MTLALRTNGLRTNAMANFVGQFATALLSLVFTPLYLRQIGVESYGVIGFYVALQALFAILDMGLTATLQRELAAASVTEPARIPRLLRTLECLYMPGAVVIAAASILLSGWLAETWVVPKTLTTAEVADGIALLGVAAALQWPASFHMAGMAGLERQVLLNALKVGMAAFSSVGCLIVVIAVPSLRAYAGWQIFMGAVQAVTYAVLLWKMVPGGAGVARFDLAELRRTWRFAGGLFAVTLTSIVLTQADRFVLSRSLSLESFGHYSLAAALAMVLYRLTQPMFTAAAPRYAQLAAVNDHAGLVEQYHSTNRVMALILVPTAVLGAVFPHEIVLAWSGDPELTDRVAPIVRILVVSYGLHGLMSLPYAMQLAHGWTRLSLYVNLVSIFFVVPMFVLLGNRFGGVGAAYAWLTLTAGYFFIGAPLMHRRLLRGELVHWYFRDIGPAVLGATLVCGAAAMTIGPFPTGWSAWLVLVLIWSVAVGVSLLLSPQLRSICFRYVGRLLLKQNAT